MELSFLAENLANKFGTPLYVYSQPALTSNLMEFKKHLPGNCTIHYAVKANPHLSILKVLKACGCGADIVSGGELYRCLRAGFDPSKIVFSGVGKTADEVTMAVLSGVHLFNVESISELTMIDAIAGKHKSRVNVSLRVNPDVPVKTHPYIATGLKQNKFGLSSSELRAAYAVLNKSKNLKPRGLSCHIGSQITDLAPLLASWAELIRLAQDSPFEITELDLGGGLGIPYSQAEKKNHVTIREYSQAIKKCFKGKKYKLHIEPGRSLVGNTGLLLTKIVQKKIRGKKRYYIVDAGMNDLLRPALYKTKHGIIPACKNRNDARHAGHQREGFLSTIAGPVCESADVFIENEYHGEYEIGELLCIMNVGAYGMSMASQYNSRPKSAEVLIKGRGFKLITKRETHAALIKNEIF